MRSAHRAPCSGRVCFHRGTWSILVKLYFLQQNWPAWLSVEDDWFIACQTSGMDQSQCKSYSGWPQFHYEVEPLSFPLPDSVLLREQGQTCWDPSSNPISNSVNLTGMGSMEYSTVVNYLVYLLAFMAILNTALCVFFFHFTLSPFSFY